MIYILLLVFISGMNAVYTKNRGVTGINRGINKGFNNNGFNNNGLSNNRNYPPNLYIPGQFLPLMDITCTSFYTVQKSDTCLLSMFNSALMISCEKYRNYSWSIGITESYANLFKPIYLWGTSILCFYTVINIPFLKQIECPFNWMQFWMYM
jgi:hypothetical protein